MMIRKYVALSEKVSRDQVVDKAWSLVQRGCQVLSIEHKMEQCCLGPDDWKEEGLVLVWEIVVDDEGARNRRIPEIKESTPN